MIIEEIISQGEVLSTEQLAAIAGGTGAQGGNSNGIFCKCTGNDNSNTAACTCHDEEDKEDLTQGPSGSGNDPEKMQ